MAGPWTLAASIWLPRGERLLVDPGATRDLVESLAEGVRVHLATVQRLVPGAELVLQLDEPSLPAVLEGSLPTASGTMRGTYSMITDGGEQFEAEIPEFSLHLPGAARKAH